jgi:hypothetical protein
MSVICPARDVADDQTYAEYTEVRQAMRRAFQRMDRAAAQSTRRHLRYADDHLLGFTGPRAEADQIKARLAQFLPLRGTPRALRGRRFWPAPRAEMVI